MNEMHPTFDDQDVRSRAAKVRSRWTPAERLRRTGLPPDTPVRLRDYILGRPALQWQTAPCNPQRTR